MHSGNQSMPSGVYRCTGCTNSVLDVCIDTLKCPNCQTSFPLILGRIVDFRIPDRDLTANFSLANDNAIAAFLLEAYPHIAGFNQLNAYYQAMYANQKCGAVMDAESRQALLTKLTGQSTPMNDAQRIHGRAVLDKIDGYLGGLDKTMPAGGVALEDGCGLGLFIDGLAERFDLVYVLDLSLCYMILASKIIDELSIPNVRLMCGSVEMLPLQDNIIDLVHSNNVIEHVNDQESLLSEAYRVLKPDGILYVQSPNRFSLWKEPHFALPAYGFIPESLRRRIIRHTQKRSIDDISLRTLGEFRVLLTRQKWKVCKITFVPNRLKQTVSKGIVRKAVVTMLNNRKLGKYFDALINKALLVVMPYHVAICIKSGK